MREWFDAPFYWYVLGFTGQMVFGSRFLVQWWASERSRRVVIPAAFWYLSLLGGVALFFYAWHKRDPVFAVGQLGGILIYARNLRLHHHGKQS
jgi:lipid-A-disaccharide synthase-like uncharacterized protein